MPMNWSSYLVLLVIFVQSIFCVGQEAIPGTSDEGKIDVYLAIGLLFQDSENLTLQGFKEAFPDSDLLPDDFDKFQTVFYYGETSTVSPLVNFLFGIRLKRSDTFEHRLRIGISYSYSFSGKKSYFYEESIPYDTLVSNDTGVEFLVDSVNSEYYDLSRTHENVGLDISYILRSNPEGRLSFFAGIGLELGAIVNSKARIEYSKNTYFTFPYTNENQQYSPAYEYAEEQYRLDGGFYGQLYLPLGLDFRLSKFNPFWKHVHVYSELRPALQYAKLGVKTEQLRPISVWPCLG